MNVGSPGTDGIVALTTISPNSTETGGRGSWLDRWLTIPPLHALLLVVAKLDPHKVRIHPEFAVLLVRVCAAIPIHRPGSADSTAYHRIQEAYFPHPPVSADGFTLTTPPNRKNRLANDFSQVGIKQP